MVEELHKPARKTFKRRKVFCKGFDDLWQIDLIDMQDYARINAGYKYILLVIDCYSRFVWTQALKNKTGRHVATGFKKILKRDKRTPNNVQSDKGTEFYNTSFSKVTNQYNINHYSTFSSTKACIAERAIRTLKTWLYKEFSHRGKYKWINILSAIVRKYNNRKHRSIGMKPVDVTANTKLKREVDFTKHYQPKYKKGDIVRISKYKSIFRKGYLPSWSSELFRIAAVRRTNPSTYHLKDDENNPILGSFYREELQKTKYPGIYLIEKILKTLGDSLYVKWLGFSNRFNSWINKVDLVN